ncbi:serine/threonine protein phosphatase family protein [Streptococcus pneumoniae]|nr:serine/threonine protein phosphatase family protein [Streptococcus pneumoniae]
MTKIALLSDIHGNTTALEAVLADARQIGVDEYWLLGDILMPGTGRRRILDLLDQLPITAKGFGKLGRQSLAWCP